MDQLHSHITFLQFQDNCRCLVLKYNCTRGGPIDHLLWSLRQEDKALKGWEEMCCGCLPPVTWLVITWETPPPHLPTPVPLGKKKTPLNIGSITARVGVLDWIKRRKEKASCAPASLSHEDATQELSHAPVLARATVPTPSLPKLALSPVRCFRHSSEKVTDADAPKEQSTATRFSCPDCCPNCLNKST